VSRRVPRGPVRHPGRPSKLTPAVQQTIVAALEAGHFLQTAAALADVSKPTVCRWLADGEGDDAPPEFRDFRDAVTRARARAENVAVAAVMQAMTGGALIRRSTRLGPKGEEVVDEQWTPPDGRVALEYLARASPTSWARRQAVEVAAEDAGPATPEVPEPRWEEMRQALQRYRVPGFPAGFPAQPREVSWRADGDPPPEPAGSP
jgi:hypothetical protein